MRQPVCWPRPPPPCTGQGEGQEDEQPPGVLHRGEADGQEFPSVKGLGQRGIGLEPRVSYPSPQNKTPENLVPRTNSHLSSHDFRGRKSVRTERRTRDLSLCHDVWDLSSKPQSCEGLTWGWRSASQVPHSHGR